MPRRHRVVLACVISGALTVAALAVTGCSIPRAADGGDYSAADRAQAGAASSGQQVGTAASVTLRNGAVAKLAVKEALWQPSRYTVKPGAVVALQLFNGDPGQHNFTFEPAHLSKNLPAGKRVNLRFTAPKAGRYPFFCKYHLQEMQGWLTVA